ncbi:hypothetical protein [Paenirhodobacter populi]|uniref:Uncharacterized protein n=1 Tax=Paenirhodobacter populi TaxID=2306993 RepID=A0A443J050_9RHOB|nr:hypothetical protein [Sinirhodobacter populi]RWR13799.1 hypothetical protein D2T33_05215 [Sinirhodobacter populi]
MNAIDETTKQAIRVLGQLDHIRSIAIGARTHNERADLVRRADLLVGRSRKLGELMREGAGVRAARGRKPVFGGRP